MVGRRLGCDRQPVEKLVPSTPPHPFTEFPSSRLSRTEDAQRTPVHDTIITVMWPLVVSALLLCALPTVSLAQAPQAVVDRFYPQQLTTSRPDGGHSCFMVLRLTSINEPDAIAAGYTDGMAVVVRLLTRVAP